MTLGDYIGQWSVFMNPVELSKVLNRLYELYKYRPIEPKYEDVFKAFNKCPYDNCKVVILGQDPYFQPNVATGIAFGNKVTTDDVTISSSLDVLMEACRTDNSNFDITLESWANQGILLLNTALTVECFKPNSHSSLWRPFMTSFIHRLSHECNGLIYVLLGEQAKSFRPYINSICNTVLEYNHPAYYVRNNKAFPKEMFTAINTLLKDKYGTVIHWWNTI